MKILNLHFKESIRLNVCYIILAEDVSSKMAIQNASSVHFSATSTLSTPFMLLSIADRFRIF